MDNDYCPKFLNFQMRSSMLGDFSELLTQCLTNNKGQRWDSNSSVGPSLLGSQSYNPQQARLPPRPQHPRPWSNAREGGLGRTRPLPPRLHPCCPPQLRLAHYCHQHRENSFRVNRFLISTRQRATRAAQPPGQAVLAPPLPSAPPMLLGVGRSWEGTEWSPGGWEQGRGHCPPRPSSQSPSGR